jgi:hypothetical protein
MTTNIEKCNAIVDAVCYWLGYQFKIGRDKLIHEASLRYPIADTLTGKGIPIDKINLEKGHPFFEDKVVDLLLFDRNVSEVTKENFKDSISEMYEFKLAKSSTNNEFGNEHQRVIDDILRLAYFNLVTKKSCYFLMCGKYDEFNAYFLGNTNRIKINANSKKYIASFTKKKTLVQGWDRSKSLYKSVFKFKIKEVEEIEYKKCVVPQKTRKDERKKLEFGLSSFQKRYKIKNNELKYLPKIKVKTTCMAITPFELNPSKTHAAAIWKIEGI